MNKFLNIALTVVISMTLVLCYLFLNTYLLDELYSKPSPIIILILGNFGMIFGGFFLIKLIYLIYKKLN